MNLNLLHTGTVFITSSAFFQQFLELCVTSYPSPLEDSAPRPAKLLLFGLAGAFEYIVALRNASLVNGIINFIAWPFRRSGALPFDVSDTALFLYLGRNFALRARSFAHSASRNGQGITVRSVFTALVSHNPALVCHVAYRKWVRWFGFAPLRMFVPNMFSLLAAKLENEMKKSFFKGVLIRCVLGVLFNKMVKHVPKLLIHLTLATQSCVFYSTAQKRRTKALMNNGHLEEKKKSLNELGLQKGLAGLQSVLSMVESLASSMLSSAVTLAKTATDTTLDHLVNRYYAEPPESSLIQYLTSHLIRLRMLFPFGFEEVLCVIEDPISSIIKILVKGLYAEPSQPLSVQYPIESGSDQIRLLTLLPSASPSRPIRTLLHWHPISNTPSYTAVSYSWGKKVPTNRIFVNNVPTSVTRSAYTVLHALRSPFRPRIIWLDAICIDQESDVDKYQQIPLMPRIYAQAANVTIWLGHSKTAHLATALVDRLFVANRLGQIDTRFKYEIDIDAARALKRMLRQAWFGRAWVVQEVVRARRKVIVQYGTARIEWTRLSWFLQCLQRDDALLKMLNSRIRYAGLGQHGMVALENVELMRRFALIKGGDATLSLLFYLVQMFRSNCRFTAREPQDYVYALLGLSEISSTTFKLKEKYRSDLRQLYVDIAHHLLNTSSPANRLDFLAHAGVGDAHNTPGLPSWAPDWSVKPASLPLFGTDGSPELLASPKMRELLADAAALASVVYTDQDKRQEDLYKAALDQVARVKDQILALLFDATKGMKPYARILEDSVLEVRARRLGCLKAVGRCYEMSERENSAEAVCTLGNWVRLALDSVEGDRDRRLPLAIDYMIALKDGLDEAQTAAAQSFAEVLCTGVSNGQIDYTFMSALEKVDPTFAKLTVELFNKINQTAKLERMVMQLCQNTIPPDVTEVLGNNMVQDLLRTYAASVGQNCVGRCFGIAKDGRMGLFPGRVQVGDELALVAGAKVPFVLREVEMVATEEGRPYFELVGPVFVKGIMYGEGVSNGEGFDFVRIR